MTTSAQFALRPRSTTMANGIDTNLSRLDDSVVGFVVPAIGGTWRWQWTWSTAGATRTW